MVILPDCISIAILDFNLTEQEEYEFRLKAKRDAHAREFYVRKEGIAIGRAEGIVIGNTEAILELLAELGPVPKELEETVMNEKDSAVLRKWLKLFGKSRKYRSVHNEYA